MKLAPSQRFAYEPQALKWSMPTVSTAYVYFAAVTLVAHDNSILVATTQTPDDVWCLSATQKAPRGQG